MNILQRIKYKLFKRCNIGRGNRYDIRSRFIGSLLVCGNNNTVIIAESAKISNLNVSIQGDNNTLIIDADARIMGPCNISLEGNGIIHIGKNSGVRGVNFLAKSGKIIIGELVMFSYGINIRNNDSHRIFYLVNQGEIINTPKDIVIGNHVWIGMNVTILKGVTIGDNSILALGAVVTKSCPPHCIMAGNPAKIVKTDICWDY